MTKIESIAFVVTLISLLFPCTLFTISFSQHCKSECLEIKEGKKDIEILNNDFRKNKNPKKSYKAIKYTKKILSYIILVILGIFLSLSVYSKFSKNIMPIGNKALLTVASGSMSYKNTENAYLNENNLNNQFQTYDIIVVSRIKEEDLKLYDVIAYRNDKNVIIIHRIIRIEETTEGKKYYTRGDANNKTDDYIDYKDIIGRYTNNRTPKLGLFVLFLQSYSGLTTIIAILYCIFLFDYKFGILKKEAQNRINIFSTLIKNALNENDYKSSDLQYIYYQNNVFKFENGVFKMKIITENNIEASDNFYIIFNNDNNTNLVVTDLNTLTEKELTQEDKKLLINEIVNSLNEKE